jgi:hypothetical protein
MTKGEGWENVLSLKHIRTSEVGGVVGEWENGIEILILTFQVEISQCLKFLG